jgi:hypothetical protein
MPKNKETQKSPDGVLIAAARSIGAAAGTIAAAVGIAAPPKPKVPKLVNRNKSRLPQRQKKGAQKAATKANRTAKAKAAS